MSFCALVRGSSEVTPDGVEANAKGVAIIISTAVTFIPILQGEVNQEGQKLVSTLCLAVLFLLKIYKALRRCSLWPKDSVMEGRIGLFECERKAWQAVMDNALTMRGHGGERKDAVANRSGVVCVPGGGGRGGEALR